MRKIDGAFVGKEAENYWMGRADVSPSRIQRISAIQRRYHARR